jgi:hypothetical protein
MRSTRWAAPRTTLCSREHACISCAHDQISRPKRVAEVILLNPDQRSESKTRDDDRSDRLSLDRGGANGHGLCLLRGTCSSQEPVRRSSPKLATPGEKRTAKERDGSDKDQDTGESGKGRILTGDTRDRRECDRITGAADSFDERLFAAAVPVQREPFFGVVGRVHEDV